MSNDLNSHPAGWLFSDRRPFWDVTTPDMPYADCRATTTADAVRKEPIMATKKNVKTNTTEETAMAETTAKKLTPEEREARKQERYAANRAAHDKAVADLLAKKPEPAFDGDPIFFINELDGERQGKKPTSPLKLTGKYAEHDAKEMEYLRLAASVMGWDDVEFATVAQAARYQGALADEDAVGWTMQSGETFWFTVYPYSAFVWDTESGDPEYDEDKGLAKELRRAQREANRKAKAARAVQKKVNERAKAAKAAAAPAAPAKVYRITMADGTVLEAPTMAELKEMKEMFAA